MSTQTITRFYSEDHDKLDGFFKKFQELKRQNYPEAKTYFREFKFGLQRHIVWEEEILFPVFEEKTGMKESGPTFVMRQEHRQIGAALEALHEKVRKQDPESDAEEAAILDILSQHNMKEESILYPAIDQHVSGEETKNIFKAMENIPEDRYRNCCGGHHHA